MYDFDEVVNRIGTNCAKWDELIENGLEGVTPMWVADMDFATAPQIVEAMKKVVEQRIFGYHVTSEKYYNAIISWMKRRHHFEVEREWICHSPNVVAALRMAVQAVSEPGDEIIIQTPVYGHFYSSIEGTGRTIVESPMTSEDGYYTMNLEDFEQKITDRTKAVILCNPHNPAGRVWTRQELQALADICVKHDLYIISDDIHSDLVYKGHEHTMIASLSEEIADRCIVCSSPTKSFNLAGMQLAYCVIKNKELREKCMKPLEMLHITEGNIFEEAVTVAAYEQSEAWLDELLVYIEENADYFVDYINTHIPALKVRKPEGTYLAWVDCSGLDVAPEKVQQFFIDECQIYVNDGAVFGEQGKGFVRFNLACPRSIITDALERMKNVLGK